MAVATPAKYRKDYQAPQFAVPTTELTFVLADRGTLVTHRMNIEPLASAPVALVLDGEQLELESLTLNGKELTGAEYEVAAGQLTIAAASLPSEPFNLEIVTRINPIDNHALEGLYKSAGAFCTQCEAEGFRRITYAFDRPDVLSVYTTRIIADAEQYPALLANGNLVERNMRDDGLTEVVWHDPYPKPCYLFALVAGDFDVLEDTFVTQSGREVSLQLFVDKGNLERADYAMGSLKRAMKWDEERFGLEYDLDIYMIVAVDFFNMGAMENKGLNIFNSKYVLASAATATDQDFIHVESVIGHEYFHNWTGNRITCRDWFQLSLKEGLTVFRDQEFSSDLGSRAVHRIEAIRIMRTHQFNEDASPMAHPIRPDKVVEMNNFYTVTVYNKGAEVIRMLHTLLGEEGFQRGMQTYIQRHDGQAVTCEDFVAAMEAGNGVDLTQFRRWYSQAGTPEVRVQQSYDAQRRELRLRLQQHTPATIGQEHKQPVVIPILLSAYAEDAQGQVVRVKLAERNKQIQLHESASELYIFDRAEAELVISDCPPDTTLALLENFSAPVRLKFPQTTTDQARLLGYAEQAVTRWEAAQQILLTALKDAVAAAQPVQLDATSIGAFKRLLQSDLDSALIAEALTVPSPEQLAEEYSTDIPVEAIATACQQLRALLGRELSTELDHHIEAALLQNNEPYALSQQAIGQRALAELAWSLRLAVAPQEYGERLRNWYASADNMTVQATALRLAVHHKVAVAAHISAQFEQQWRDTPLALDKWFAVFASQRNEGTLQDVQKLLSHPGFSLNNPNRVYALLATLSRNLVVFHDSSGATYQFLADIIAQLNELNPQVAARLITPFLQWQRFDHARQTLLKQQLERLEALPNLSRDLAEKIQSALHSDTSK